MEKQTRERGSERNDEKKTNMWKQWGGGTNQKDVAEK